MTSLERLDRVRALVEWQARLRDTLDAKLDPGFTFDDRGTLVDDLEDFRLGASTFAGYADLSFIELVASESATVAVLFEATDIVTGCESAKPGSCASSAMRLARSSRRHRTDTQRNRDAVAVGDLPPSPNGSRGSAARPPLSRH